MATPSHPGGLVSVLWAAHKSGDTDLARVARRQLRDLFGIEVRIRRTSPSAPNRSGDHQPQTPRSTKR